MEVRPGTKAPREIGGRQYTGHALDRMQGRWIPPSAVDDALEHGDVVARSSDAVIHYARRNNVSVVVSPDGRVVTVGYGRFRLRSR